MIINPVVEREIKTKMRRWRAPALLAVYLFILGFVFWSMWMTLGQGYPMSFNAFSPLIVIQIFCVLCYMLLALVLLIVPGITSSSINGERERQTLDLMLCTTFSPYSIINGKIVASILHVMLLIVASFPILGVAFLYGGIDLTDIAKLMIFYISTAFMVSALGVYVSCLFKKVWYHRL